MYYQLRCITCNETFKPVLATLPGELLVPDFEEAVEHAGTYGAEALRHFHSIHGDHYLEEVVDPPDKEARRHYSVWGLGVGPAHLPFLVANNYVMTDRFGLIELGCLLYL